MVDFGSSHPTVFDFFLAFRYFGEKQKTTAHSLGRWAPLNE